MNVKNMYHEMIVVSLVLNFFDSLLTALSAFSIGFFIVYFYRLHVLLAVIAGGVFFIRSLIKKIKENKILLLEKKYPDLRERLRTSFDYQEKTNTVISQLHSDIIRTMKRVDVNAFLNRRTLIIKIILICSMLGSTLYMSSVGFDVIDIRDSIVNSQIYERGSNFVMDILDETRDEVKNRPTLDEARLIQSGNQELNISIDAYNTELDIGDITDSAKNDYGGHYPEEIAGYAQETYEEKIPEEHKDIIKEYFKRINK